jgi:hypothetical protein
VFAVSPRRLFACIAALAVGAVGVGVVAGFALFPRPAPRDSAPLLGEHAVPLETAPSPFGKAYGIPFVMAVQAPASAFPLVE